MQQDAEAGRASTGRDPRAEQAAGYHIHHGARNQEKDERRIQRILDLATLLQITITIHGAGTAHHAWATRRRATATGAARARGTSTLTERHF